VTEREPDPQPAPPGMAFTADEVSALLGSGPPGPKVGDHVVINNRHEQLAGQSGTIVDVRPDLDGASGATMLRVTVEVWVTEEQVR
jgi:hypothetical protein